MGFTSPSGGGAEQGAAPAGGGNVVAKKPTFGDWPGTYFQERYPIAGGLAGMVFGNNAPQIALHPEYQQPGAQFSVTSDPDGQDSYSQLISMNAQPKQGGGLSAILKLLGV